MIVYKLLPHQKKVIQSQKTNIFLGGGVGSGKTDIGAGWILKKVQDTPTGAVGLICANSYAQLVDSTIRNIFKNWQAWGQVFTPALPPTTYRPFNLKVLGPHGWIDILCRSLDHYETLAGIEAAWCWTDEVYQTKAEALHLLSARVRDKRSVNQMLYTSTLDDPDSWMYERFVEKFNPDYDEVIYSSSYDNPHLPLDYIDRLKASYDPRTFDRMVLSKWVTLSGTNIYYNFDRALNIDSSVFYDGALPILWTHDFNIGVGKPMSSCLCQIKKVGYLVNGEPTTRQELHCFDEIILNGSDTYEAIEEFKGRYPVAYPRSVVVYGDASGNARDTRSNLTDYTLLRKAGFVNQKVPRSNPPVRDRHNAVNAMLCNAAGDLRIKIHPRCKTLIKGLETVQIKKGSSYLEEETYSQHVTTALGYLINQEFPIVKYVSSGLKYWK